MQNICGFLNINKPKGYTSHDVVAELRKVTHIKKIGHSGTLDPLATGVLVIGFNEATRLFEYLAKDKTYIADIIFGVETNTDDITGTVKNTSELIPSLKEIKEKVFLFKGNILQKPPIFSAVKLNGERAYKLARNEEINLIDLKEKEVEIYSMEILSYEKPNLKLKIHCSGGTYIRSIARDLGRALNTYATLAALERIKAGKFTIEESVDLKAITDLSVTNYIKLPASVLDMDKVCLDDNQVLEMVQGKKISINNIKSANFKTKDLQLLNSNGTLIGIGQDINGSLIQPKKVFVKHE